VVWSKQFFENEKMRTPTESLRTANGRPQMEKARRAGLRRNQTGLRSGLGGQIPVLNRNVPVCGRVFSYGRRAIAACQTDACRFLPVFAGLAKEAPANQPANGAMIDIGGVLPNAATHIASYRLISLGTA